MGRCPSEAPWEEPRVDALDFAHVEPSTGKCCANVSRCQLDRSWYPGPFRSPSLILGRSFDSLNYGQSFLFLATLNLCCDLHCDSFPSLDSDNLKLHYPTS